MNKRKALWLGAAVAAAALLWLALRPAGDDATPAPAKPSRNASAVASGASAASAVGRTTPGGALLPFSTPALQARQAQAELWGQRLARAEQTLAAYRASTRYPHEARPIAEHPDQVRPFDPVLEDKALRSASGEVTRGVQLRTSQDRVYASGAETVRFSVSAVDDAGRPLPLLVTRAVAFDLPEPGQATGRPQVGMSFNDAGQDGDAQPGDGVFSATLRPALQGFADYAGTIRVQLQLNQNGRQGVLNFELVYHPLVPAEWAGVREALGAGSLDFFLKARVLQAGRYVVSARVDDANGQPFALLSFNEEVAVGQQEFRLRLFGKLLRDKAPAFPLALRDVQGFVLFADRYPDRAMMARLPGVVHRSASYPLSVFSDAEWSSEERQRYLDELGRDVSEAQQQLAKLKGP